MSNNDTLGMSTSLVDVAARFKVTIVVSALVGAILAFAAASLMTPAYRAEAVFSPQSGSGQSDLMVALGGQLGGLGALAGIGLGGDSARNERIATLTSRDLATKFIRSHRLTELFCSAGVIECREANAPGADPSEWEMNDTLKLFVRRVLTVSEDKRTGLVRVSMTWIDREQAAQWANEYVALANAELLAKSVSESDRRIAFLRDAADKAETVELRQAVYKLLESEIKSKMVASSRADFAFKVVDPALLPDQRHPVRPRVAVLSVVGAMLGALAAFAVLLLAGRKGRIGSASKPE